MVETCQDCISVLPLHMEERKSCTGAALEISTWSWSEVKMQVGREAHGSGVERARVEANKAANMNTNEDASANFAFTRKPFHDVIVGACRMPVC